MASHNEKFPFLKDLRHITRHADETDGVRIENCIGFVPVPIGIAGPLRIEGTDTPSDDFYAPLATTEAALVAACSRGCKAFSQSGGLHFEVLQSSMSRAPAFVFPSPKEAIAFARIVPALQQQFEMDTRSVSKHTILRQLTPNIIGSTVHVRFEYQTGDAAGQNMATIATQKCIDTFTKSVQAEKLLLQKVYVEGQMTADKKPSWGNVFQTRGVRVMAWGTITNEVALKILKIDTASIYQLFTISKEAEIRNGQFGSNINAANVISAFYIACGQDPANAVDGSWCQLTPEFNRDTGDLKLSLYFPSLAVGSIGGGTAYEPQRECLQLLKCEGPGMKSRLAGLVASFALAMDLSSVAAVSNNTFTNAHASLRKNIITAKADGNKAVHGQGYKEKSLL